MGSGRSARLPVHVDLKADRARATLLVQGAHGEPEIDRGAVVAALADELRLLADWLELERIEVRGNGDLSSGLAAVV